MRRALVLVLAEVLVCGCGDSGGLASSTSLQPSGPSGSRPPPTPPSLPAAPAPSVAIVPQSVTSVATVAAGGPVVDLFYAIHVHASAEWSPFSGPELTDLDTAAADGYVAHVEAIAGVLDAHDAVGSFHFTFGTAAGLCQHAPDLCDDLESLGHEIGIHANRNEFLLLAATVMVEECGRPIATGSGLAAMAGGPDGTTAELLAASFAVFGDVGAGQLMVNMSDWCGTASAARLAGAGSARCGAHQGGHSPNARVVTNAS